MINRQADTESIHFMLRLIIVLVILCIWFLYDARAAVIDLRSRDRDIIFKAKTIESLNKEVRKIPAFCKTIDRQLRLIDSQRMRIMILEKNNGVEKTSIKRTDVLSEP